MRELIEAPVDAPGSTAPLAGLGEVADQLRLLCQEVHFAVLAGADDEVVDAAEQVLALQRQFVRRYRTWLASGRPGESMST